MAPAGLAVRQMFGHPATLAEAERAQRCRAVGADHGHHPLAAPAADELVVLLGQPPAGAEQGALDHRPRHAHALADLLVGEAFELAQDENFVVALRQTAEGATQIVEL